MLRSAEDAAISAVIALAMEVSSDPKAGNVDRGHDFEELKFEDFLISAITAFPYFLRTAKNRRLYILNAIEKAQEYGINTNVHFGAFLLLFPLVAVWDSENSEIAGKRATEFLKSTSYLDSLKILRAFNLCKPRVLATEELSLQDRRTAAEIIKRRLNIYEWMKLSPKENLIAKELLNCYEISVEGARFLLNSERDERESIVLLYHKLLAEYPDTLIIAKKGIKVAEDVMRMAKKAIEEGMDGFRRLDEFLIKNDINPGTIADITASSIFLAILEGWKVEAKRFRIEKRDK
uniref:Triphosphoribosyl-dephospho-CoA synthase n=1 Tax=Archaeoglobus fulgidus TaxID=2234 RepID=A0A7J2TJG0_ARCFL